MAIIVTGAGTFINVGDNGPFPVLDWPFGGFPTISTDIAIMAIFLFLFLIGFVTHLILFFVNLVRGRFVVQFLMTLFALFGMTGLILRIASTLSGYNGQIYLASQVFIVSLEVILLFANLAFAHQVIRSQHGGGILSTLIFITVYLLTLLAYAMQLGGIGQTLYTLDSDTRDLDYNMQIWATTWYAFVSLLPIALVLLSSIIPGRHRRKASAGLYLSIWILMIGSLLVAVQAWYIAGVMWMGRTNRFLEIPTWMTRAWYYVIIWSIDTIVMFLYIFARVDRQTNNHNRTASGGHHPGRFGAVAAAPVAAGVHASGPWGGAAARPAAPPKKKRGFGFGRFALGAGGAGAAALALKRHRKKKSEKEELREEELDHNRSPVMRGPNQAGIPGGIDARTPLGSHPTKEVRGFDTETIPEESEESDDSLYAVDSTMGTDSKRHSVVSPLDRSPNQTPKPV